jgi:hypothetical protein
VGRGGVRYLVVLDEVADELEEALARVLIVRIFTVEREEICICLVHQLKILL